MTGSPAVGRAAVSAGVNPDRLWHRHLALARIGATGRGGVNRQALTPGDAEARRQVLAWAAARGFAASVDALEAAEEGHIATTRPLELVIWTNEEGARFQPTTMGSAVFAGALPLDTALDTADGQGVTVRAALAETLAATPVASRRPFGFPIAAYVEAHIEQGPILEATGITIGLVTGIQGLRW